MTVAFSSKADCRIISCFGTRLRIALARCECPEETAHRLLRTNARGPALKRGAPISQSDYSATLYRSLEYQFCSTLSTGHEPAMSDCNMYTPA